ATLAAASTAKRLKALIRARGAFASSAILSSWARWSMAKAIRLSGCGRLVVAQRAMRRAMFEEMPHFRPGEVFGRTEQPRHGEGAAGIGVGAAGLDRLVAQPAAQEAGHEGVAGAEHVEH